MPARRIAALVAVALVGPLAAVVTAGPAGADELEDKRREAAAVADQLDALQTKSSTLDEQYNQVASDLTVLDGQVTQAEADVSRHESDLAAMRGEASGMALRTYMNPDANANLTGVLNGSSAGNQAAQRQGYASVVLGLSTSLTDRLKAATDDAQAARDVLADKRQQQAALQNQLAERRVQVDAAIQDQEKLQASVQGELARLVEEEQRRREAEAAAAAQRKAEEEAARKAAAEKAAQEKAAADQAAKQQAEAARAPSDPSSSSSSKADPPTKADPPSSGNQQAPATEAPRRQAPPKTEAPRESPATEAPKQEKNDDGGGSSGAGKNVPSPQPGAAGAVAAALSQQGVSWRFAAASPGVAFDCSGLTMWAWAQAGVSLPHSSQQQYNVTTHIDPSSAQPGDLFFFGSPIHHVGIYIGGGQMMNAVQSGTPAKISSAYRKDLVGVGRV